MKFASYSQFAIAIGALMLSACSTSPPVLERESQLPPSVTDEQQAVEETPVEASIDPRIARAFAIVVELMQEGEYREAAERLQKLIEQAPQLSGLHLNYGIAMARQGDNEAAEAALQKAVEVDGDNAVAWNQLGILYRNAGRFSEARNAYQLAVELDPNYQLAHLNLGILCDLYLLQGDCALAHYTRFLALKGEEDQEVQIWIADIKQRYPDLGAE